MTHIDNNEFSALLLHLPDGSRACSEAREWAKGKTLHEVWATCERGDWLLWLLAKMIGRPGWATHQQVVSAACDCAELALKYVPKGEERPRKCIEVTRRWARGEATIEEVRAARRDAAYAADAAAYAAADAAADAAYAADPAAYAAYAADAAARTKTLAKCADLVRAAISEPRGM